MTDLFVYERFATRVLIIAKFFKYGCSIGVTIRELSALFCEFDY
jgi:hypothetical protein